MPRRIFCVPVRVAALMSALTVFIIFGLGAAAGWCSVYSIHHFSEYNNVSKRTQAFAIILGVWALVISGISGFGSIALIMKRRSSIQHYLWSSWSTFFLAVPTVTLFAILVWVDNAWFAKNCTYNDEGKATSCEGPPLWLKIFASLVAAYGLALQLYLSVVLRLYYEELQYERVETGELAGHRSEDSHDLPNPHESLGLRSVSLQMSTHKH